MVQDAHLPGRMHPQPVLVRGPGRHSNHSPHTCQDGGGGGDVFTVPAQQDLITAAARSPHPHRMGTGEDGSKLLGHGAGPQGATLD